MTANERVRYRKLPGCRRGIFHGSSAWLGPDHLLLVRSWRFREEYRRFHVSDIQSIAVAEAPRFHISTRSIGIAVLWLIAISIASTRRVSWAETALWILAVTLIGAWAWISAKCSCVCRIYTAVSGDDLPSVYRTWTARKFISRVQPLIVAAQGAIESDWANDVDARRIGPPEFVPDMPTAGTVTSPEAAAGAPLSTGAGSSRLPFAEILVALMLMDALFSFATRNRLTIALTWLGYAIVGVELGIAIALIVRHARGKPWPAMQWLAIGSVLLTALIWWGRPFVNSIVVGVTNAQNPGAAISSGTARSVDGLFASVDIGAHFLLGIVGMAMIFARRGRTRGMVGA